LYSKGVFGLCFTKRQFNSSIALLAPASGLSPSQK
jgi:hypothetical protein